MGVGPIVRPNVPLHNLDPAFKGTPGIPWAFNYVSNVPESAVGWMVAQGWNITYVYNDNSTMPPTAFYTMARMQMNNLSILQNLVNDFTAAYNEGREKNALRYDDIVSCWLATVTAASDQLDGMASASSGFYSGYNLSISGLMNVIDELINTSLGVVVTDTANVTVRLTDFLEKLADLEKNYTAHRTEIDEVLAREQDNLAAFLSAYEAELAKLETSYGIHLTSVRALMTTSGTNAAGCAVDLQKQLNYLASDFATHETTATNYLVNLGSTELARINEQYADSLAAELQQLTDRGFYSSQMVSDVTARNTRERNEAIAELNDKLAREKLDNEHKLYEQKVAMRARTIDGLDRIQQLRDVLQQWLTENEYKLQAELDNLRVKIAEGHDRRHSVQQEVERNEAGQLDKELSEQQSALGGFLDGKQKHIGMTLDNSKYQVDARSKLCADLFEADKMRLKGMMDQRIDDAGQSKYGLDAYDKLLVGFMDFMEKRTDSYPDLQQVGNIVTQLGDAGSTQVLGT